MSLLGPVDDTGLAEAERCTKGFGPHRTCIQALAEGWVLTSDMCPRCTRAFMQALDRHFAPEEPLTWHHDYAERAR